jgi:GNAT superfamily N-acetyltransferase
MTRITVRQAGLADLDVAARLFDGYRRFQGQPGDLEAATRFLRARQDHGESVIFLAFEGEPGRGEALGFAQLYPSYSSVALQRVFILNDLFVADAGRRKGVATKLLEALEAYAWALGAVRVSLNVAQGNTEAQALYEVRGWQRDAQFFMYHRHAAGA